MREKFMGAGDTLKKLRDLVEDNLTETRNDRAFFNVAHVAKWDRGTAWWNKWFPRKPKLDCGTSVCAMGLMAISGEFAGVSWRQERHDYGYGYQNWYFDLTYMGKQVWYFNLAQMVLGVTHDQAMILFNPDYYRDTETPELTYWTSGPSGAREFIRRCDMLLEHDAIFWDAEKFDVSLVPVGIPTPPLPEVSAPALAGS